MLVRACNPFSKEQCIDLACGLQIDLSLAKDVHLFVNTLIIYLLTSDKRI